MTDTEIDERASKGILISETRVPRRHRFVLRLSRRLWLPLCLPLLSPFRHSTTSHFTRKDRKCCKEQRTSPFSLFLPRPNSQFVASPFPPRLRIKLQFCRQKSLKNGSSQGSSPSLQCRSHGSPCRLPKIVAWKWESICFQNELVLFSTI